jgi:formate-dependent nitrite reductase membrane component NrfD
MSLYIVWYLFFAGVGSGTFIVTVVETRRMGRGVEDASGDLRNRALAGFMIAALCMAVGSMFLVFDLGDPLNSWRVFLAPFSSITAFGACCVVLFTGLVILVALAVVFFPVLPQGFLLLARTLGVALAAVTMVYAGILLAIMPAVPVWHTWLIPVLFVVSSLACGLAVFLFLEAFLPGNRMSSFATWQVHVAFSLLEAAVIIAFVLDRIGVTTATHDSIMSLLVGEYAPAFWIGGVAVGLVAPVIIHILYQRMPTEALVITASLGVLIGAFFLRYCIVGIALHVPLFVV